MSSRNPTFGAGMAIDNEEGSRWATDGGTKQAWLEIDLGKPLKFGRVTINEAYADRVRSFEVQCKDGAGWKTLQGHHRWGRASRPVSRR